MKKVCLVHTLRGRIVSSKLFFKEQQKVACHCKNLHCQPYLIFYVNEIVQKNEQDEYLTCM